MTEYVLDLFLEWQETEAPILTEETERRSKLSWDLQAAVSHIAAAAFEAGYKQGYKAATKDLEIDE